MEFKPNWQSSKNDSREPSNLEQPTQHKTLAISTRWSEFHHPSQPTNNQSWQVLNWNLSILWQDIISL